ncbi:alanine racemase [Alkalibacillus aidingensis]|uniref:alanine racemase n=1 Tax=Alkalibacillus aidingensis TaxID=2747607 RepID=UPI001660CEDC|nr:alanine racemase [Alkalibacillus aidingensis]
MKENNFYRDTWAEVDLIAIKHNIREISKLYQDQKNIYAVVKANAYGHGDVEVAKAAIEAGANRLAVALLDEAIKLRQHYQDIPILVLGRIRPEDAPIAAKYKITVTVFQKEWVQEAKKHLNDVLSIHLKIDTGMNRIGIRTFLEAYDVLNEVCSSKIEITGIYTHFATADEEDQSYLQSQLVQFQKYLQELKGEFTETVEVHVGNSAAAMRYPESMYDAVRFGIGMYGLYPSDTVRNESDIVLKPAFSLHSRLTHVKEIEPGESVSYGATYTATENEWIGTIPIGYGDGWTRKLQNFSIMVDGKKFRLVGRICMDQCMVKLNQPYPVDTKVTLIGVNQGEMVTMDEVADYLDTINYEIPCMINQRVPRVFINH